MRKIVSVIGLAAALVALFMVVVVSAAPEDPSASTITIEPVYQFGDSSVKVGDIFTQRVRFERTSATGNLQFEIQVDRSIMFETFMRPTFSKSGSVTTNKVFQTDDALHWRGSVNGNGFVEFEFPTRVGDCGKPPENCPSAIAAKVVNTDGETVLSDDATVSLAAGDFDRSQIMFETIWTDGSSLPLNGNTGTCLNECESAYIAITNNNSALARVVMRVEAPAGMKSLGYIAPEIGLAVEIHEEAPAGMKWNRSVPATTVSGTPSRSSEAQSTVRYFDVSVKPNDTVSLTLNLGLVGNHADKAEFTVDLKACTEQSGNQQCPFADGMVDIDSITFRSLRRDLGDAPDSSNHAATVMEAYTGVQANFPTTADPALTGPHGPYHTRPWPLHLGRRVSFESGADVGLDQDGVNNLEPSLSPQLVNQDRGDDGVPLNRLSFEACKTATIPVRVAILPAAVALLGDQPAYINVWLDGNRDGDWADTSNCGQTAYEHIVIDHEVDVAALGAGFHTISVTTGLLPDQIEDGVDGAWMRVMLAGTKSTKLSGQSYGDGRGKGSAYILGETEDSIYYADKPGSEGHQPNIEISIEEVDRGDERRDGLADNGRAPYGTVRPDREMIIRFRNTGYEAAENLEIDVTLSNVLDKILYSALDPSWCLTCLRSAEVYHSHDTVLVNSKTSSSGLPRFRTFEIGRVEPGGFGTIVLGWTGCLTCVRSVEAPDAVAFHTVLARTADKQWEAKLERRETKLEAPFLQIDASWCLTCVRSVEDGQAVTGWDEGVAAIKAKPGQTIKILKNGVETGETGVIGPDGSLQMSIWVDPVDKAVFQAVATEGPLQSEPSNELDLTCPASGVQLIAFAQAGADNVPNYVPLLRPTNNFGLPDIRYLSPYIYTDEFGRLMGNIPEGTNFIVHKNCRNQSSALTLNFAEAVIEFDEIQRFGDITVQTWTGCLTCTRSVEANDVTFTVVATPTGKTQSYEYTSTFDMVDGTTENIITDALTGQPIADAEVMILRKVGKGVGRHTWRDIGHCVTTLKDGSWQALVPAGEYMVVVKKDGYQSYRSQPWVVFEGNDEPLFDPTSGRFEMGFNIGMPPSLTGGYSKFAEVVDISNGALGNGFVQVPIGTPVRFENNGGADTSLTAQIDGRGPQAISIDSGQIASGESYKVQFDQPGKYTYQVAGDASQEGVIVVTSSGSNIYLPLILR